MTTTERAANAEASKLPRVIRRTSAGFPVRKIGNDYRDVGLAPDALIPGNPMIAQLFCGISMFFPPGERFMIAAAKSVQDRIEDPQLRAEIDMFVRQEAQHATEHSRANKYLAGLVGLDNATICREINALWQYIGRHGSARQRAGFTAATEHFTGFIAEVILADIEFIDSIPESKAKQMLVWHGIEECEHKAVVFDAYKEIGGSEIERIAIMAAYTGPVFIAALLPAFRLIAAHGQLSNLAGWRTGLSTIARRWTVPMVKGYLQYYRPGFHPNHSPTRHLEQYWRTKLQIVDDGQRTNA
ncbi:metal-dependent hydrolase [Rhodococcus sp. G-MC3]|uniref:metal-dependent hydrolase n=1 Tax=Rhodococcus sp. G-MC3 TaxID=3046209 RepID=UPI0024BAE85D|nr:metal-dependent hydrolase [Rhodococcus sp. G-MC3]MDJ0392644.1 metal-dependent hydrolase [Rhodococcus sp. G-MC3]